MPYHTTEGYDRNLSFLGLIRAAHKFDETKGIKFISYAVWWIRAYIQNYIMRSWSLVKIGTTQMQKKLFIKMVESFFL